MSERRNGPMQGGGRTDLRRRAALWRVLHPARLARWRAVGVAATVCVLPVAAVAQTTLLDPVDEAAPPFASPFAVLAIAVIALGVMALLRRRMRQEAIRADHFTTRTAQLEATLDGADLAVAGWPVGRGGAPVATPAFLMLFEIDEMVDLTPVLDRLLPEDAAGLEADFATLHRDETPFARDVVLRNGSRVAVTGRRGRGLARDVPYDVLTAREIDVSNGRTPETPPPADATGATDPSLRRVLDALPMPAWIRTGSGALAQVNEAYAAAVEMPAAEAVARNVALDGETLGPVEADGPSDRTVPVAIDGHRRHLRLLEVPIPTDPGGTAEASAPPCRLGLALDRTDIEAARADLRRQSAAQQEILGTLRTAVAVWGPDRRLAFCNPAFESLWRLEAAWLATGPTIQEVHDELRRRRRLPEVPDRLQERERLTALFTDTLEPQESALHLPDGTALRLVIAPHPMGGLIELADDETDALQIERDYNTLMAVQAASLENLVEAVLVSGEDGRIRFHNAAFATLWGIDSESLAERPHLSVLIDPLTAHVAEDDRPLLRETLQAAGFDRLSTGCQIDRRDGRVVDYSTVPLPDGSVMHRFLDITDSKEVERALIAANEALGAADKLKSEFVANVSYQLRTPLNAIGGFAEILSAEFFGPLNDRQREYAAGISRSAGELQALVDAILDLASIDAGLLEIQPRTTAVDDLLRQVVAVGQEWVRGRNLELDLFLPTAPGIAVMDEARVKQVLYNLLSNAAQFTQSGGRVAITARREEDRIVFVVSDTGSGVAAEDRRRVFNRFVAGGKGRGAGLGLSLVDSLVALHGGTVHLEANRPSGTRVVVSLPADGPPDRARTLDSAVPDNDNRHASSDSPAAPSSPDAGLPS